MVSLNQRCTALSEVLIALFYICICVFYFIFKYFKCLLRLVVKTFLLARAICKFILTPLICPLCVRQI